MNENWNTRTAQLLGESKVNLLASKKVAVFGIGGVGSYVVEALARAGVGSLVLVDSDDVSLSNLNRQLIALRSTVGKAKVEAAKARIHDINPDCDVTAVKTFVTPENLSEILPDDCDYAVDAVDNVTAKIALIVLCQQKNIPVISSMGTGNKLHPELFEITDIYKTSVCPLARVMRNELKKRGIKKQKVLFSTEIPVTTVRPPASVSFVPSTAGLLIAGEVVRDLTAD